MRSSNLHSEPDVPEPDLCPPVLEALIPPPPRASLAESGAARLLLALALVSLGAAFAAVLTVYFVLRSRTAVWPPPGTPPLPAGLWLSTALIVLGSGTMHAAVRAARQARWRGLQTALVGSLLLAGAFLLSQTLSWGVALAAHMPPGLNLFTLLFYILTGLHAVHLLAGFVPLGLVTRNAFQLRYMPTQYAGVQLCAWYWHFVAAVWLVIFGVLLLTG
jgi:cytochrome c oxidase subunit III